MVGAAEDLIEVEDVFNVEDFVDVRDAEVGTAVIVAALPPLTQ